MKVTIKAIVPDPLSQRSVCVEKMLFIGTFIATLGGKLDAALTPMDFTNINIATHTPEVTDNKTIIGSRPMIGLSQFKRETLIIPLTYRGYTDCRASACGVALTRSTGRG